MKNSNFTRRQFLGNAAKVAGTAAVFSIVPRNVLGGPAQTAPSDQLTKAVIGVGGMGQGHLRYGGAKLLAICDVDEKHLQSSLGRVAKDVKGYKDFREVIDRDDIDIIHVPTPPHWHGLISIAAAEAGKDVWCEKPMTRTIGEGKKVRDAVQRNGRIFRLNTSSASRRLRVLGPELLREAVAARNRELSSLWFRPTNSASCASASKARPDMDGKGEWYQANTHTSMSTQTNGVKRRLRFIMKELF